MTSKLSLVSGKIHYIWLEFDFGEGHEAYFRLSFQWFAAISSRRSESSLRVISRVERGKLLIHWLGKQGHYRNFSVTKCVKEGVSRPVSLIAVKHVISLMLTPSFRIKIIAFR